MASSVEAGGGVFGRWRRMAVAVSATVPAVALSGCVSTQQKAAWHDVVAARIRASQNATLVRRAAGELRVLGVTVVRSRQRVAIAVQVANAAASPLTDVPISVGVRRTRHAAPMYLNAAAGVDYFATHLVSIPARSAETWVLVVPVPRTASGPLFAVAGSQIDAAATPRRSLPRLRVRLLGSPTGGLVRVRVSNPTGIPQPNLQLYAVGLVAGRVAAAGATSLAQLAAGQSATATVPLIGDARGARVEIEALPTLF